MGNLFDAILILSLVAITVICYKLGFVKLLRPFRKIAALVLAWCLKGTAIIQGTIGKIIKTDKFKVFLTERVDALWGEKIENALTADGVSVTERFDDIFGFWGKMFSDIKDFCISLYDKDYTAGIESGKTPSEMAEEFVKSVTEYIGDISAEFFTMFFGFIILFALFYVGFWIFEKMLDKFFDDGVLGTINRLIGGAVGLCYGFLFSWVLSIIFVLLLPLITSIDQQTVTGGFFHITEWFYSKFFLSLIVGITL